MSIQHEFAQALLAPDAVCPEGVFSSNGADPASRFAVYRNNVHSSLNDGLAAAYPVVRRLVGDEFFHAMAGLYVQAYPPTTPLISEYGSSLADFIQGFAPITRRIARRWTSPAFFNNCKAQSNSDTCVCNCTHRSPR